MGKIYEVTTEVFEIDLQVGNKGVNVLIRLESP